MRLLEASPLSGGCSRTSFSGVYVGGTISGSTQIIDPIPPLPASQHTTPYTTAQCFPSTNSADAAIPSPDNTVLTWNTGIRARIQHGLFGVPPPSCGMRGDLPGSFGQAGSGSTEAGQGTAVRGFIAMGFSTLLWWAPGPAHQNSAFAETRPSCPFFAFPIISLSTTTTEPVSLETLRSCRWCCPRTLLLAGRTVGRGRA